MDAFLGKLFDLGEALFVGIDEIGGLALYLASRASSYVTGTAFAIDGGWTAQ